MAKDEVKFYELREVKAAPAPTPEIDLTTIEEHLTTIEERLAGIEGQLTEGVVQLTRIADTLAWFREQQEIAARHR